MKILLIDDNEDNLLSLELLIEDYMEDKNISEDNYEIIKTTNPKEGLDIIFTGVDIVFLDIMMPNINGFDILEQVRKSDIKQPVIIMASALGDRETLKKEQKLEANAYIVKPFVEEAIKAMLDKYFKIEVKDDKTEDDFEEDFFDLDSDEEFDEEFMDNLNKSHRKLSAKEFLTKYEDVDDEVIESLEEDLNELIFKLEQIAEFYEIKEYSIDIFDEYRKFLFQFSEFDELYSVVSDLVTLIENIEEDTIKDEKLFKQFIIAIANDLIEWEKNVFIEESAVDVFYINASMYNSLLQLKMLTGGGKY